MSLRVLFVASWYPSSPTSVDGVFIREHARAAALDHDVAVFHLAPEDRELPRTHVLQREDDDRVSAGLPTWHVQYRRNVPGSRPFHRWAGALRAAEHVASTGFRPDVVHANVHETAIPSLLIAKRFGVPAVLTEHASAFPRGRITSGQLIRARLSLPRMHAVMPVSDNLRDAMVAAGIAANFEVVPNTFDPDVFHPPVRDPKTDSTTRLLFVGMMKHVKGLDVLVAALARLRDLPWTLDLVGDGPDRPAVQEAAHQAGIADRFTFHGLQPKPVVAERMRAADTLVLSSRWENLPCVAIEAMACGLPVVASRVGGVPELIDQDVGILVPPDRDPALAAALRERLRGSRQFDREEIAARARKLYSLRSVGARFTQIYEAAVRGVR